MTSGENGWLAPMLRSMQELDLLWGRGRQAGQEQGSGTGMTRSMLRATATSKLLALYSVVLVLVGRARGESAHRAVAIMLRRALCNREGDDCDRDYRGNMGTITSRWLWRQQYRCCARFVGRLALLQQRPSISSDAARAACLSILPTHLNPPQQPQLSGGCAATVPPSYHFYPLKLRFCLGASSVPVRSKQWAFLARELLAS